jgi:serine/threonine-protein kinase
MNDTPQNITDEDITPMTVVSTTVRPTGKYSLKEGDLLGSYRIRKPLGKGGMGEVYLALHTKLNVLRAIKILPARYCSADKKFGERFLQEARMAIQLDHPNVISVYDAEFDEKKDIYYSVMEYVDGGTVRNAIRSLGSYMERQALMIVLKVSEALIAADPAHTKWDWR